MIDRERFLAVLNRESNEIFSWTMSFFDEKVAERLLGSDCIPSDILPGDDYDFGASPLKDWEIKARFAEEADMPAVPVGWGAGLAFGHGGPGEFREKTISVTEKKRVTKYETGVMKEVRYDPHFYHHFDYPLTDIVDLDIKEIPLPDPDEPRRYQGLAEEIAYHKTRGRMTFTNLNGFFSGVHYFLYPYAEFLMDLILKPNEVKTVVDALGEYNLRVAEHLLATGVDIICFCDDLGSGSSLLMNPELYRKYFRQWHGALADLCHQHGAILHMHSHGNINAVMKDLYEVGIDMLNPVDPYEDMDLPALMEEYGDRITFVGGINKFFFDWEADRQKDYLTKLFSSVKKGFFLMDSGGIPEQVNKEEWDYFRNLKRELKKSYKR